MWCSVLAAALSSGGGGDLRSLLSRVDNSWTSELAQDPDMQQHAPNHYAREVRSGHYVLVEPTALPAPYLVATSAAFAARLRLGDGALRSEAFLRLFSGDVRGGAPSLRGRTWATPYALSIYGEELVPNGAGARGDGYGDGRAISIAEVVVEAWPPASNATGAAIGAEGEEAAEGEALEGERWELQLKGSGRTPFARGGDGRAVLRSSVREFLASEAMHALGVPTTRALSLTASATETSQRPWYKNHSSSSSGSSTDRRTRAPPARHGGDVMQEEPCAITTRAARSFARVGTFELYGRRARAGDPTGRAQLEQLARHVLWRDYGGDRSGGGDRGGGGGGGARALRLELLRMAREARQRFADLAADWLRVGYVQSNFNSDNCLASGTTVDYGPFGFIERYDAAWGMWIGSGSHFAFMNQPVAAGRNYAQLVASLEPLFDQGSGGGGGGGGDGQGEDDDADAAGADLQQLRALAAGFGATAARACGDMWTRKLGLRVPAAGDHAAAAVHEEGGMRPPVLRLREALEPLLSGHATGGLAVDYTLFWRQLAEVAAAAATREGQRVLEEARDTRRGVVAAAWPPLPEEERLLLGPLRRAFYGREEGDAGGGGDAEGEEEEKEEEGGGELGEAARSAWLRWLRRWLAQVVADGGHGTPGSATVQALGVDAAAGASSAAPVPNATAAATATTTATASAARAALAAAATSMKRVSPKYVPREWMLVEAYRAAEEGDHGVVHALQRLFAAPYDEQPASEERFYRRAPVGADEQGGIGFMS
jgi:uncharacterized protein YdiU (UPF0061 family)